MHNIRLAKNSGFCFGVKRAIRLAEETATKYGKATTIGPIIHNPQMVEKLNKVGVKAIDDLNLIGDEPVIIRSHGVPVQILEKLTEKGCVIVDATCPYVAKAHDFAKKADAENYEIVILGNPAHPEISALKSYIKAPVTFWETLEDNGKLSKDKGTLQKIAIICQTTQDLNALQTLTKELLPITNELRIFNTICNATNVRQQSSLALAKQCDMMFVIGGKNSSNTKMLAKLCSQYSKTIHIEQADEVDESVLNVRCSVSTNQNTDHRKPNIGLTAGASTPDWIILDIYNKINKIVGEDVNPTVSVEDIPGYKEEQ